jgi:phosphoesterase RecJ-like protein
MDSVKILKTFAAHKKFLISTHMNPDPDALAAELVLYFYLKALGKSVYVVNEEKMPQRFMFLPGARVIRHSREKIPQDFDVVIVVDCGELRRIGSVQKMIFSENLVVNIDHHVTNDLFGHLNLVVPK